MSTIIQIEQQPQLNVSVEESTENILVNVFQSPDINIEVSGIVYGDSNVDLSNYWTKTESDSKYKPIGYIPTWNSITNKPVFFSGNYNDLINKPTLFNGTWASLSGTPTTIEGYGITNAFDGDYNSLSNKPTSFTPSTHTHEISDINNLQGSLENYYLKSETYSQNEVNNLFLNETLDAITDRGNTTENNITVGGITTDYVQLDTTSANTYNIGKVYWNSDKGTYNFGLKNNVELQLGQEQHVYGKAYSAIINGQLVMYRTSQGGHILFEPANFTQLSTNPDLIIGVATQDIALNDFGYITTFGEVNTLNTSSFADGDTLYFGSGNILQNTIPSGSYFIIGRVNHSHSTQGSIFVKPYFVDSNLESKFNKSDSYTTSSSTTYASTKALVDGLATKQKKESTITITGNTTLSEIHNGAVLNVTNTCNITIPTGLDANFQCVIFSKGSIIVTFVSSGVTIYAPSGLLLKTDKMASLISTAINNFNLTGELATV